MIDLAARRPYPGCEPRVHMRANILNYPRVVQDIRLPPGGGERDAESKDDRDLP
jgi:hypothetical protein